MLGFAIGDSDMITGFRLVGIKGIEVTSIEEAKQAFGRALRIKDVAIIIISEEFSKQMRGEIDNLRSGKIKPLIVELPGSRSSPGESKIFDLVSKSVGIRL